jgi:hypothetical protein
MDGNIRKIPGVRNVIIAFLTAEVKIIRKWQDLMLELMTISQNL